MVIWMLGFVAPHPGQSAAKPPPAGVVGKVGAPARLQKLVDALAQAV